MRRRWSPVRVPTPVGAGACKAASPAEAMGVSKLKGRYRLPWSLRRPMLRQILRPRWPGLSRIRWFGCTTARTMPLRSRPTFGQRERSWSFICTTRCRLFSRKITDSFRADRVIFCSRFLEGEASASSRARKDFRDS